MFRGAMAVLQINMERKGHFEIIPAIFTSFTPSPFMNLLGLRKVFLYAG